MLSDSGKRTQFNSGAQREIVDEKGRCDLLPLDSIGRFLSDDILMYVNTAIRAEDTASCIENLWKAISLFSLKYCSYSDYSSLFLDVAIHYADGAKKYSERNWEKGLPIHSFIDSGIRHYLKCKRGDKDEPHNRAFVWNLLGAIWMIEHKPELNDLPGATTK